MRYNALAFSGLSDAELCRTLTALSGLLSHRRQPQQGDLSFTSGRLAASPPPSASTLALSLLFSRLLIEALNRCASYDAEQENVARKVRRRALAQAKSAKWNEDELNR